MDFKRDQDNFFNQTLVLDRQREGVFHFPLKLPVSLILVIRWFHPLIWTCLDLTDSLTDLVIHFFCQMLVVCFILK